MQEALPLSLFDYVLPAENIAQHPASPRDSSRLMRVRRSASDGGVSHHVFRDIPDFLNEGDVLVVNTTKVIPARVRAHKTTGGKAEFLLCRPVSGGVEEACEWEALARPSAGLKKGLKLKTVGGEWLEVTGRGEGTVYVRAEKPVWDILQAEGSVPLPPYVQRPDGATPSDREDYQTVFAQQWGAVAAPTASLHFTPEVLAQIRARGVVLAEVLLHVGAGTFLPVRQEHANDVRGHTMHEEVYDVPVLTQEQIKVAKEAGKRVVAVGTTSLRALETWVSTGKASGVSSLFVWPGFVFKCVDALVTNFHVPQSTLLMLVSALAGRERILQAYETAVKEGYRFFSYGDAMLID